MPGPGPDPLTPTLLRTAYNVLSAAIYRAVAQTGAPDMRPAHGNAMEMLAIQDGLRLTYIAARAGMAPQSMGELVDDLVGMGTWSAARIRRPPGQAHLPHRERPRHSSASKVAMCQVEEKISEILGTPQYQQMRRDLAAIAELDVPMTTD